MRCWNWIAPIGATLILSGCPSESPQDPGPPTTGEIEIRAEMIVDGLASPVYLTAPPGDPRLFIVEQAGRIRIVEGGRLLVTPFLDISAKVRSGGERGLLSVAFHPDYATNGHFYVNYTDLEGDTRIERYRVGPEPDRAEPGSAMLVLSVAQPFANHNGGLIKFGPDGMLWIGLGDGGSGGDPQGHGQNRSTLLGAMLRIDVDGGDPYGIPAGNAFAGGGGRPEIWAIGLRNPWRFSFDRGSDLIYVADVGQNRREEVNAVRTSQAGLNFGWKVTEGSLCHSPPSGCDTAGLTPPVFDYPNPQDGCSVTGGYVYRGAAIPEIHGHYFYGDYCDGEVRSFRLDEQLRPTDHATWSLGSLGNISSFGEDAVGELYVVVHEGRIYRIAS